MLGVEKLILVGDPQQLPALTMSKVTVTSSFFSLHYIALFQSAKEHGYGHSLFARIKCCLESNRGCPIRLLTTQYRMHPKICHFPNVTFYNGKLTNSSEVVCRKSFLDVLAPYLIFSVSDTFKLTQEYVNRTEMDCVIRLLEAILTIIVIQKHSCSIGIVTPYNNQKGAIYEKLKHMQYAHFVSNLLFSNNFASSIPPNISVCVNTVDSFQGQERDIMIMSCVRVNSNEFVGARQRLNVAMTRAKHALYIIGSSSLFEVRTNITFLLQFFHYKNWLYIIISCFGIVLYLYRIYYLKTIWNEQSKGTAL